MLDLIILVLAVVAFAAAILVVPTAPVRYKQLLAVGLLLAALVPLIDAVRAAG